MTTVECFKQNISMYKENLRQAKEAGDEEEIALYTELLENEQEGLSVLLEGFSDCEVSHYSRMSGIETEETNRIADEIHEAHRDPRDIRFWTGRM